MRIRTVTYFATLEAADFDEGSASGSGVALAAKLDTVARGLAHVAGRLGAAGYEVQTLRVTFNSWTAWLPAALAALPGQPIDPADPLVLEPLAQLQEQLARTGLSFCSLGQCSAVEHIRLVPHLLALSSRFNCSVRLASAPSPAPANASASASASASACRVTAIAPGSTQGAAREVEAEARPALAAEREACVAAAEACLLVQRLCGDDGNFRFAGTCP